MRFPKLYNFFRRSKSDTALAAACKPSQTRPVVPRPASASFLDEVLHPEDSRQSEVLSEVLASVAVDPISVKTPKPELSVSILTQPSQPRIKTPRQHDERARAKAVGFLTERVYQLEAALQTQAEENERVVSVLEEALKVKATALKEARDANVLLTSNVTKLQSDLMHARGELYTAHNHQLRFSSGSESERNITLLQENDRLRKFTRLIISCGAHNSVLELTASRVEQGYDPEDSIVDAIKVAMEDPSSVWRRLLDPLVGLRSPQDYLAQTMCTLKARRETRDWQKKARFWKDAAREEGRHTSTVTPSTSQLSDVVSEVSSERRVVLDDMLEKLRMGSLRLTVDSRTTAIASPRSATQLTSDSLEPASEGTPPLKDIGSPRQYASQMGLTTIVESASESEPDPIHELVDPFVTTSGKNVNMSSPSSRTLHPGSAPSDMSVASLAPLASVAFRESHSIKSVSSRRRRSHRLTPSSSISSQDSRLSKLSNRKAKILAVSRSTSLNKLVVSPPSNLEFPGASDSAEELTRMLCAAVQAEHLLVDGVDVKTDDKSESSIPRASSTDTDRTLATASDSGATSTTNTLSSAVSTPPRKPRAQKGSPQGGQHDSSPSSTLTPVSSPEVKKSKLPVLKLASVTRSIKRLSISKPVLVDTTNAAAAPSPSVTARSAFAGIKNYSRVDESRGDGNANKPVVRSRLQMISPRTRVR